MFGLLRSLLLRLLAAAPAGSLLVRTVDGVGGGSVEVSLYGQNLTNDRYKTTAVDFGALGLVAGAFNRPRVIGVESRFAF